MSFTFRKLKRELMSEHSITGKMFRTCIKPLNINENIKRGFMLLLLDLMLSYNRKTIANQEKNHNPHRSPVPHSINSREINLLK